MVNGGVYGSRVGEWPEEELMINVTKQIKCNGCRHQLSDQGGFCYMFEREPDILPCAQHDKYADLRRANGRAFLAAMSDGEPTP